MIEDPLIKDVKFIVGFKKLGKKEFYRSGKGADFIQAYLHFKTSQSGIRAPMLVELERQILAFAEFIKNGEHRTQAGTRHAKRNKVKEVLNADGTVKEYRKNGRVMSEAQIKNWMGEG